MHFLSKNGGSFQPATCKFYQRRNLGATPKALGPTILLLFRLSGPGHFTCVSWTRATSRAWSPLMLQIVMSKIRDTIIFQFSPNSPVRAVRSRLKWFLTVHLRIFRYLSHSRNPAFRVHTFAHASIVTKTARKSLVFWGTPKKTRKTPVIVAG